MQKRYQIFVSSTYLDLIEARNEVIKALLELDCIPCGMEYFPAANEDQWTYIKSLIDDCDYYVVIIGGRYGSISKDGISYTQQEYEYAVESGIPTIAFVYRRPENLPQKFAEPTPEGRERLEAFLKLVKSRMCKEWENPYELGAVVSRSVTQLMKRTPRPGWVKADKIMNEDSVREMLELNKRVKELEYENQLLRGKRIAGSESLAQDDEKVKITVSYSIVKPHEKYQGSVVTGTASHNVFLTWNQIFQAILPHLQSDTPETSIKGYLSNYIYPGISDELNKKHEPSFVERVNLTQHSFQIVKVQMSALGFINVKSVQLEKKLQKVWEATPLGLDKMYKLLAVKKA